MTVSSAGPDESASAFGPYLRAIRSRALVVALITLAAVGVAAVLLATRSPSYKSTAQLLVSPLPQDDSTFLGTGLLRDSGDPTRTVQTAAALVASPLAADRTARRLGGGLTGSEVSGNVDVQPLGQSNILSVTASSDHARRSDAAGQPVRAERAGRPKRADPAARSRSRSARWAPSPRPTTGRGSRELRAVRADGDPTLTLSQAARPPSSAGGAPAWLVLALAAIAGLHAGVDRGGVDGAPRRPRSRRARAARARPAPDPRAGAGGRAAGAAASERSRGAWSAREAFRTLQIQLDQGRGADGGGPHRHDHQRLERRRQDEHGARPLAGAGRRRPSRDPHGLRPAQARRRRASSSSRPSDGLVALLTLAGH